MTIFLLPRRSSTSDDNKCFFPLSIFCYSSFISWMKHAQKTIYEIMGWWTVNEQVRMFYISLFFTITGNAFKINIPHIIFNLINISYVLCMKIHWKVMLLTVNKLKCMNVVFFWNIIVGVIIELCLLMKNFH